MAVSVVRWHFWQLPVSDNAQNCLPCWFLDFDDRDDMDCEDDLDKNGDDDDLPQLNVQGWHLAAPCEQQRK